VSNDVDILHYVDKRFDDHDNALAAAIASLNLRLAAMNELRAQFSELLPRAEFEARHTDLVNQFDIVKTLIGGLMPRVEYDARHKDIVNQVDSIKTQVSTSQGRQTGVSSAWSIFLGLGGFLTGSAVAVAVLIGTGH
jgi:hypothetical protein